MGSNKQNSNPSLTANGELRQYVRHSYNDHALECNKPKTGKEEDMLHRYTENRVGGPFPLKLHIILKILEEEGNDCIVSWLPHGRAFVIHDSGRFEQEVVKRFFKHSQISSFRRQLNLYGFLRLSNGRDTGAYYHQLFLRGKPVLSLRMIRTKVKGTKIRASSSPADEPRFYVMPFLGPVRVQESDAPLRMARCNPVSLGDPSSAAMMMTAGKRSQLHNLLSESVSTSVVGSFPPSRSYGQSLPLMQQSQQSNLNRLSRQSPDLMQSSSFMKMNGMAMPTTSPARYGSNNLSTQDLLNRTLEQGRRDLMSANMLNAISSQTDCYNPKMDALSSMSSFPMGEPSLNRPMHRSAGMGSMMPDEAQDPRLLAHKMARAHYFSQFDSMMNHSSNFLPNSRLSQQFQYSQDQRTELLLRNELRAQAHAQAQAQCKDMLPNRNAMPTADFSMMENRKMMKTKMGSMQIDAAAAMVSLGAKMERKNSSDNSVSGCSLEEKDVASTMMSLGSSKNKGKDALSSSRHQAV